MLPKRGPRRPSTCLQQSAAHGGLAFVNGRTLAGRLPGGLPVTARHSPPLSSRGGHARPTHPQTSTCALGWRRIPRAAGSPPAGSHLPRAASPATALGQGPRHRLTSLGPSETLTQTRRPVARCHPVTCSMRSPSRRPATARTGHTRRHQRGTRTPRQGCPCGSVSRSQGV